LGETIYRTVNLAVNEKSHKVVGHVTGQSNMSYDLLTIGETMIALAPRPGASIRAGDSLLVDHAGAESNTAVGLARLGFHVAWVSCLGDDDAGSRILDTLTAEGVDTRWVRRDPQRPTGLMLKDPGHGVRYYRTGSAASAMGPELLDGVPVADARAVLVTGVTALIGAGPQAAGLALLTASRGLRIVDPNLRHGLWGSDRRRELVRPFVERCDLLLCGVDELEEVLADVVGADLGRPLGGANSAPTFRGDGAEVLARRAVALGPREVVVRGVDSIGVLRDGTWTALEIRRDAAVDPIGAGDAFNAGYIAVRLRGGSIDEALRAGIVCGTAVTTSVSDTAGFPRRAD
jgi:2-dehydro-3-deoxygluconokinase